MSSFESEWQTRFERFARVYPDEARISGWSAEGFRRRVDLFRTLVRPPDPQHPAVALELGCGAGTYVRLLAELGYRTLGLDYSLPTLLRATAADPDGKGYYLAGEAYALPCRAQSIDFVVSIGVLQALSSPERILDEIARILRPGGRLLLEVMNSRALIARARQAHARIRGLPLRVATYDPFRVTAWIEERGFQVERRALLYLPPRGLPSLGRFLSGASVQAAVEHPSHLAHTLAHAVWFVCRRHSLGREGHP